MNRKNVTDVLEAELWLEVKWSFCNPTLCAEASREKHLEIADGNKCLIYAPLGLP
jgi:hypothetical protein